MSARRPPLFIPLIGILAFAALSGCSNLMGNLRRDLDDAEPYSYEQPPVVGGRWAEKGFLGSEMPESGYGNDRYVSVGHSERSPASGSGGPGFSGGRSWVGPETEEANRRDNYRGAGAEQEEAPVVAFSNTPAVEPTIKRKYKNGRRATRDDFVDDSQNEGSLWASDGQTNYYFTKNKIRGVGDIITMTIEPELAKDVVREVQRTLTPREKVTEMNLAQERIRARYLGLAAPEAADDKDKKEGSKDTLATSSASAQRGPAAEQPKKREDIDEDKIPVATSADMDLSRSVEIKPGETMMGEIVERYPNGNYKIRAVKKVAYKRGAPRLVTLVGVVRGADINEEDIVTSGKLYEYRLEAIR